MDNFEKEEREYEKRMKHQERRTDRNFMNTLGLFSMYFVIGDFLQSIIAVSPISAFERNMVFAITAAAVIRHQTDKKHILVFDEPHPVTGGIIISTFIIIIVLLKIFKLY